MNKWHRRTWVAACWLACGLLIETAAAQPAKIALVIGNAGYTDAPALPQAKNDAQAMAQTLKQLGFQVILALDADKRGMDEAMERFGKRIENGGVALFYYSGHGLQEDGINYLIPLASGIKKKADIPYQAVSANWALASMEEWNEQGVNLMILDACRTPFKGMTKNGLAPMEAAGSVVAYATAANTPAEIEPGAAYSVYTAQLLKVLQANPCQKITDLLLEVADLVVAGGSGQQPYLTLSPGVRRFQFAECAAPTPAPQIVYIEVTPTPAPKQPTPRPSQEGNTHPTPSQEGNTHPTPSQEGNAELPSSEEPGVGASCWENATPGATCAEPTTGMKFVYAPGGCFQMGQTKADKAQLIKEVGKKNYEKYYQDELPRHEVCVKGFWMGKYEVTQAQWQAVMGSNPSNFQGVDRPVEMVSWNDAQEFLRKLNATIETHGRASLQFRLPSEAEWEYAARAGTQTVYSFGDDSDQLGDYAWFNANSGNKTHPVGQKKPNAFGLYDMHGNVWEWQSDTYHKNYNGAPTDGSAWESLGNEKAKKLLRGGSWCLLPGNVRGAYRYGSGPDHLNYDVGVRVVRVR